MEKEDSDVEDEDSDVAEEDSGDDEEDSSVKIEDSDVEEADSDAEEMDSDIKDSVVERDSSDVEELDSDNGEPAEFFGRRVSNNEGLNLGEPEEEDTTLCGRFFTGQALELDDREDEAMACYAALLADYKAALAGATASASAFAYVSKSSEDPADALVASLRPSTAPV